MPNSHVSDPSPPPPASSQALLTFEQAARELAISRRTLVRLVSRREFPPPLKIGRSSRVAKEDIASYLEKLRHARDDKIGTS